MDSKKKALTEVIKESRGLSNGRESEGKDSLSLTHCAVNPFSLKLATSHVDE